MNALRAELLGHALGDGAEAVFAGCECGEVGACLHGCGCAGEQDRPSLSRNHAAGGFTAD